MKKILSNLQKRHFRIRSKVSGTATKPRLSISKSSKNMYVQLIDDEKSLTLLGLSTKYALKGKKVTKSESSKELGKLVAEKAIEKGITSIVFDRGGYKYHGRVKMLAEGAREKGLVF